MASKKGVVLTIGILAVITGASFLVWLMPQNNEITIVVSDFESHLDGVKEIHGIISEGLDEEFQDVIDGKRDPKEYIEIAKVSSSQINDQIIQLVQSKATEEWLESYIGYIESLKHFNTYIRETIVVANLIDNNTEQSEIEDDLEQINKIKSEVAFLIQKSDEKRP